MPCKLSPTITFDSATLSCASFDSLLMYLAKKSVKISISDTGRGISAEEIKKVCEPFFSSHKDEGMRGLGLAIVRDIVGKCVRTVGNICCNSRIQLCHLALREKGHWH